VVDGWKEEGTIDISTLDLCQTNQGLTLNTYMVVMTIIPLLPNSRNSFIIMRAAKLSRPVDKLCSVNVWAEGVRGDKPSLSIYLMSARPQRECRDL